MNNLRVAVLAMYGFYGYYLAIFNPLSEPVFKGVYGLSPAQIKQTVGNVNMLFSLGALTATLVSGPISENIGRKRLVILYDIGAFATACSYWFKDLLLLQVLRFLGGFFGAGAGVVSAILITEIIPKKQSGVANTSLFAAMTGMITVAYIQQNIFTQSQILQYWQYILCWPAIFILLKVLLMPIVLPTESPKFFIKKNYDKPDLREKLQKMYSHTYRESQTFNIADSCIKVYTQQQKASVIENDGEEKACAELRNLTGEYSRKRLLSGLVVAFSQQICGVSFFALYSTDLFNRISGKGKQVTFFLAISKILGGLFAVIFMKAFGRKFNFHIGILTQCLSIVAIVISMEIDMPEIAYFAVVIYMLAFAVGLGGAFPAYLTEILPPVGVSAANSLACTINASLGKILPLVAEPLGDENILLFFAGMCIVCFLLLDRFVIETKDKDEELVIEEFLHKKYRFLDFS